MATVMLFVSGWLFSPLFSDRAETDGGVTLRFAHFGTFEDYELWARLIERFRERRPDVYIHQEFAPGWYGAYETKLRQQRLVNQLPELMQVQSMSFLTLADAFEDLTPLLGFSTASSASIRNATVPLAGLRGQRQPDVGEFQPTALEAFAGSGHLPALPTSGGNLLIYCNLEALERAVKHRSLPIPLPQDGWTAAEFRELAEKLTCDFDQDGAQDQFGFWMPSWVYYLPFLWSFGAEVYDESDSPWRFHGPQAEAALDFYQGFYREPRVCPRPAEVAQIVQDVGFLTGKVAMCVNGPWFLPFLEKAQLADRIAIFPIPRGPGGRWTRVAWDGVALSKSAAPSRRGAAIEFLKFLMEPEIQAQFADNGRAIPALRSAADQIDDDAQRKLTAFFSALDYSRLQGRHPQFSKIDATLNQHLRNLLDKERPLRPADVVEAIRKDPRVIDAMDATTSD